MYKISTVAKKLNISTRTLWNWHYQGKISFIKNGKMNFISDDDYKKLVCEEEKEKFTCIYARVSSSANKDNLDAQAERVKNYCIAKGYKIGKIVKEIGSGLNDERKQLINILNDDRFDRIVVEHKDRLTRSGFNFIKVLLEKRGIEIEVINNSEDNKEDIIQDFVSIIISYCARIYGKRRSLRKTEKLIKELEKENN